MLGQFWGMGRLLVGFIRSLCEGLWERHIGQKGCGTGFVPLQGDRQCPGLLPNLIDALVLLTKSAFFGVGGGSTSCYSFQALKGVFQSAFGV